MTTDRIEKQVLLQAPQDKVWRALTDSGEFGHWFGVRFDGPFIAGETIRGSLVGSGVNEEVAASQRKHSGITFELQVETIRPETLFSFRWHPYALEQDKDYSQEPTTLVQFKLEDVAQGVMLTVVESGFDRIPLARRAAAFTANEGGWTIMIKVVEEYLAQPA